MTEGDGLLKVGTNKRLQSHAPSIDPKVSKPKNIAVQHVR